MDYEILLVRTDPKSVRSEIFFRHVKSSILDDISRLDQQTLGL